jgi:glycosyltransferase involved in cell wall biosynthesis
MTPDPVDRRAAVVSVVWGPRRGSHRAEFLAAALGMPLVRISAGNRSGVASALVRYPRQIRATWRALARRAPTVVVVQSPPVIAVLVVWWWCRWHSAEYIVDTHSGALMEPVWRWATPITRGLARRARTSWVATPAIATVFERWGAPCDVVPDPPIDTRVVGHVGLDRPGHHVCVVTNPAPDEPLEEVLDAAHRLRDVTFHVTGDWTREPRARALAELVPPNVQLCGHLPDDRYFGLLAAVDVVVSLTTLDATFQSGASEALWMGTPVVTSDWPHLRTYFTSGATFAAASAPSIARAVTAVLGALPEHRRGMAELQQARRVAWDALAVELQRSLAPPARAGSGQRHCIVVHARFPLGEGPATFQADALTDAGHAVEVVCLRADSEPARTVERGIRVHRMPVRRHKDRGPVVQLAEYAAFFACAFMHLLANARRYNTVQVHAPPDALVFAALPARLSGARVVLFVRDLSPEFARARFGVSRRHPLVRTLARVERAACRYADHVITVSPLWRDRLSERARLDGRISVVWNLPPTRFFSEPTLRARRPVPHRPLRGIYHGTITHRSGLDVAIRAIALLRDRGTRCELVIRGVGELEPLRRLIAEMEVTDRVRFETGFVPYEDLASHLVDADLTIVPYRDDPFTAGIVPTKLLECAFLDLPAVASRTEGITSAFDESTTLLVPPDDAEALADALAWLDRDRTELLRMREGLAQWRARYDVTDARAGYLALIDELVAMHPEPGSGARPH